MEHGIAGHEIKLFVSQPQVFTRSLKQIPFELVLIGVALRLLELPGAQVAGLQFAVGKYFGNALSVLAAAAADFQNLLRVC